MCDPNPHCPSPNGSWAYRRAKSGPGRPQFIVRARSKQEGRRRGRRRLREAAAAMRAVQARAQAKWMSASEVGSDMVYDVVAVHGDLLLGVGSGPLSVRGCHCPIPKFLSLVHLSGRPSPFISAQALKMWLFQGHPQSYCITKYIVTPRYTHARTYTLPHTHTHAHTNIHTHTLKHAQAHTNTPPGTTLTPPRAAPCPTAGPPAPDLQEAPVSSAQTERPCARRCGWGCSSAATCSTGAAAAAAGAGSAPRGQAARAPPTARRQQQHS